MPRITIFNQTKKTEGSIKVRFRITDGRAVQLYHRSEIEATLPDLSKFEADGTPKKRANYNRKLHKEINDRITALSRVYERCIGVGMPMNKDTFDEEVDRYLFPNKYQQEESDTRSKGLLSRFGEYIAGGLFSEKRKAGYWVAYRILERYLKINQLTEIGYEDVTPDFLMNLRDFIINEYQYASKKKYSSIYAGITENNFPTDKRSQNTVSAKLKMLRAFFAMLEDADEIVKSPFRKLGRETRQSALREQYLPPVALSYDELRKILKTDVSSGLRVSKDAFLLQCALGCRISDFQKMSMDNVVVDAEGIPYVRYVAEKTKHLTKTIHENRTPLIRFAYDIIMRTGFNFPVLKYATGKSGFNAKIKELLKFCGIDREVSVMSEGGSSVDHRPLYEIGSSKLGRKTNVTLLSRVQINTTIGGLHAEGSTAVAHYYDKSLKDLFMLMSRAFGEELYQVDSNLNIM